MKWRILSWVWFVVVVAGGVAAFMRFLFGLCRGS